MPPHPAPWGLGLAPPASQPLHQDNAHHLCSPSWATWAEEAETKKGEEGDPRVGVSLFFPAPTGWRVGVGWDRRDRGRERERERDNQGRVTQRETRRATDSQIQKPRERKSVLRRGERHIKCRRQVGKLSEGEISAREGLRCQGEMVTVWVPDPPHPAPTTKPVPGRSPAWLGRYLPARITSGLQHPWRVPREPHRPRGASDSSAEESTRASVEATPGPRL